MAPPRPQPISSVHRKATAVGVGIVLVGVALAVWSVLGGDAVFGIGFWLFVAVWLVVPAFPAARTFRWSSTTDIRRPAAEVLERFADPQFVHSVEAAGEYDPRHPGRGSLEVEVLERMPDRVRLPPGWSRLVPGPQWWPRS